MKRRKLLMSIVFCTILFMPFSDYALAALIGSSQSNPGKSAKHILQAGGSVGNGIYWIDPNGGSTSDAFQAFCDMTTDGGGWTLGVHSIAGDPSSTTDMTTNTGSVNLAAGHTRDLSLLIYLDAELRHVLVDGTNVFDAKYTGRYHDGMASWPNWTTLPTYTSSSENMLDHHFGMLWTTTTDDNDLFPGGNGAAIYGVPWYYGNLFEAIPTLFSGSYPNPPYGGLNPIDSYSIYVRESSVIPVPTSMLLLGSGLIGLVGLRRKFRS